MGVTGDELDESEVSEDDVEAGEGVAFSGISIKAREGKDPDRRRVGDGDVVDGEEDMILRILLRMWKMSSRFAEFGPKCCSNELMRCCVICVLKTRREPRYTQSSGRMTNIQLTGNPFHRFPEEVSRRAYPQESLHARGLYRYLTFQLVAQRTLVAVEWPNCRRASRTHSQARSRGSVPDAECVVM